jgi:hypothetical protein
MFTGLNKATQKTWMPQKENSAGKGKEIYSQTNVF